MNKLICLAFLVFVSLSLTHSQSEADPIPDGDYAITFTNPFIPEFNTVRLAIQGSSIFLGSECGGTSLSYYRDSYWFFTVLTPPQPTPQCLVVDHIGQLLAQSKFVYSYNGQLMFGDEKGKTLVNASWFE